MTATKSSSNAKANFLFRLYRNRKISIFFFIMSILSAPLFLLGYTAYCSENIHYFENHALYNSYENIASFNDLFIAVFIFSFIVMATIVVFIALKNFEYNITRSKTDMYLSLPISRSRRFLSDYLSGLVSFAVPFLCSGVLLLIISFFSASVFKKANDSNVFDYYTLFRGYLPYAAFKYILVALLVLISLYTLSVLVVNICGTVTESLVFILLLNLFVPLSASCLFSLCVNNAYGVVDTVPEYVLTLASPYSGVSVIVQYLGNMSGLNLYIKWMIPYILFIGIMICLSFVANRKRKAEDTGKPVVFRAFYSIAITIMIISIGAFAYLEFTQSILLIILFTSIVYFVAEVCINRGFKKLYKGAIRYAVTVVCVIVFVFIAYKTEGFGIAYRVPSENSIKSVAISNGPGYRLEIYNDKNFYSDINKKYITDANKTLIDKYINNNHRIPQRCEELGEYSSISIFYYLKNGSNISRTYPMDYETTNHMILLEKSDEYLDDLVKMSKNFKNTKQNMIYNKEVNYHFNNEQELKGLLEALRTDFKSLSDVDFLIFLDDSEYTITIWDIAKVKINRKFKNTILYLEKLGVYLEDN